ncbi:MAG: histidinol-phosphate transaminase, partial [Gammaproteobacteria bacterium]|nr:histidinol-phosphate transaminase [Gammaproteobacteria bacterium]
MNLTNVNVRIAGLNPYQPGKPIEELVRERGVRHAVKLASNENPRGPGPRVLKALANADLSRYPDGSGFRLKAALSEHLGVETACITLGNGSNDVLDLAARVAISPGTRGIIDEHCFVVYPLAITAANGDLATV